MRRFLIMVVTVVAAIGGALYLTRHSPTKAVAPLGSRADVSPMRSEVIAQRLAAAKATIDELIYPNPDTIH